MSGAPPFEAQSNPRHPWQANSTSAGASERHLITLGGRGDTIVRVGDNVRFCSTLLATTLIALMLSGCLIIPIPVGMVYTTDTHQPDNSAMSQNLATATPLPSIHERKDAAKKDHQETAEKRQECSDQAEKLFSDAERQAYTKECMSQER